MQALNARTQTTEDAPDVVADCIIKQIKGSQINRTVLFPEVIRGVKQYSTASGGWRVI